MKPTHILSVLIVDDEIPIREELRMFDWKSCRAVLIGEAGNGKEALELCHEYSPDVVITDLTMPVMGGIDLFKRLKIEFPII